MASLGRGDEGASGAGTDRLVWLDKNVGRLAKAPEADTYSYVVQGFDDSPDVFVGDVDLGAARQLTATQRLPERLRLGSVRARRVPKRLGA